MNILLIGMTLSLIGKGLLALAIIWVHITMANEKRIDAEVIKAFRKETVLTIIAFIMIFMGYLIEVYALGVFGSITHCSGLNCTALLIGA